VLLAAPLVAKLRLNWRVGLLLIPMRPLLLLAMLWPHRQTDSASVPP